MCLTKCSYLPTPLNHMKNADIPQSVGKSLELHKRRYLYSQAKCERIFNTILKSSHTFTQILNCLNNSNHKRYVNYHSNEIHKHSADV